MDLNRRTFLSAAAALSLAPLARAGEALMPPPAGRRVVIVGGGWGGLSAARHLRQLAPELEVELLERLPAFWSCPRSNHWLVGQAEEQSLAFDYRQAASRLGYTFLQAEVSGVDRDRRQVLTGQGPLEYDWLILAPGIRHDYSAWFGDDGAGREAAALARSRYAPAYTAGPEFSALKARLAAFKGGDLLMTVPPYPYRCPPAPFERAVLLARHFQVNKIPGRITLLDANPPNPGYAKVFTEYFKDHIHYVPHALVRRVDLGGRRIVTAAGEFGWDEAILMPPQQAGDLAWQAGLVGPDDDGKNTGWAQVAGPGLQSRADERIFVIGDAVGAVSPLFGHYPKSGHVANRMGRIVAREIAARAAGKKAEPALPDNLCYVTVNPEPVDVLLMDTQYKFRSDGVIVQTLRQYRDPDLAADELAWHGALMGEMQGG
ncbi:MAG TPA: FAD/NAD(P)-binding oxidoreductase [Azospira sp.]|nr:FAD/NAD(P)-binding oxidoreductase [Azospira sp.]